MLYLGIDQHRKQLTVNVRDENGDVAIQRQVSTEWERVRQFFEQLAETAAKRGGFMAVVEVCGFNDWLLKLLRDHGCREAVLVQPETTSNKKTDRRDAAKLSQLLWVNRERLLAGKKVNGLRRVVPPSAADAQDRQLTALRKRLGQDRQLTALRKRLGQVILHVLRRDRAMKAWYQRIKKRRGAKIAKVAAMRRLATILWHMVKHRHPYRIGEMMHPTAAPEACTTTPLQASPRTASEPASERQVFQGMAGQKNGSDEKQQKRPRPLERPGPDGSFSRPGSAIPCRVAPQQSSTPFHRATTKIRT